MTGLNEKKSKKKKKETNCGSACPILGREQNDRM